LVWVLLDFQQARWDSFPRDQKTARLARKQMPAKGFYSSLSKNKLDDYLTNTQDSL